MSELSRFYFSIPPITRIFVTFPLAVLILDGANLLTQEDYLFWDYSQVSQKLQLWRPITACLTPIYGYGQKLNCLFLIKSFYSNGRQVETSKFGNDAANFLWYLMITVGVILGASPFTKAFSFYSPLVSALCFTLSQMDPDSTKAFYSLVQYKAKYEPLILLGLTLILRGSYDFFYDLSGVLAGYIYLCLQNHDYGPLYDTFKTYFQRQVRQPEGRLPHTKRDTGFIPAPQWLRAAIQGVQAVISGVYATNTQVAGRSKVDNKGQSSGYNGRQFFGNSKAFPGKGNRLGSA
ncbi:Dfm1 protein [Saccharomycopsis crataegensis]|uniref:Derlin n=1 Tax=Saccharomycopsis crataegensis TaxID=43959 RepID=A0AAV5QUG9_9ASCO|nr:Dfm1 protein [Saccharomycopsis crataegensis]